MPVEAVAQLVQGLPVFADPDLIVGAEHFSDAGVLRLGPNLAIVQSVDFFAPIVDDPFCYGQIAAANSMSDIYAMGARPRTLLNVVGFPDDKLDLEVLSEILRGGAERAHAAGAVMVGGHSVRDAEIKYGLSVTGVVDPEHLITNRDAAPGDQLVLSKPLGTGFVTTALRAGKCPAEVRDAACASMVQLNAAASEAAVELGVKAATDITGFGLAGHAGELARASDVAVVLRPAQLPKLPGADELARQRHFTRANATNRAHALTLMEPGAEDLDEFLVDPQTSGGLLIAVKADKTDQLLQACREGGHEQAAVVGEVRERSDAFLVIDHD